MSSLKSRASTNTINTNNTDLGFQGRDSRDRGGMAREVADLTRHKLPSHCHSKWPYSRPVPARSRHTTSSHSISNASTLGRATVSCVNPRCVLRESRDEIESCNREIASFVVCPAAATQRHPVLIVQDVHGSDSG